jgi:predicted N-acetyltransferase YhbS
MRQKPSEIRVRMAVAEDASAVAAVLERAFIEHRASYTEDGFNATVLTKDKVEARMAEGPMWVALDNGEIVGTVAAVSKGEVLHVRGMAIVPAARGKRIGKLMLKNVEAFAMARGHERMTLSTTPFLSRQFICMSVLAFNAATEALPICLGRRSLP